MESKFIPIQTFNLNNNCPECYSKAGLQLTFKQKTKENKFYKAVTPEVTYHMLCNTCNTTIYPVRWTPDIERVFDYHQKTLTPQKPKTVYKNKFWFALFTTLALVIFISIIVYYVINMP